METSDSLKGESDQVKDFYIHFLMLLKANFFFFASCCSTRGREGEKAFFSLRILPTNNCKHGMVIATGAPVRIEQIFGNFLCRFKAQNCPYIMHEQNLTLTNRTEIRPSCMQVVGTLIWYTCPRYSLVMSTNYLLVEN